MRTTNTSDHARRPATRPAARQQGGRRGFTLVEILCVVVILGIASAIIVPQMGTRDDMRVASAARTLIADLIYAQNQAISGGKMVYVKFDATNNKYTLLSTAKTGGDVAISHPITQADYAQPFGAASRGYELITLESAIFHGLDAQYQNLTTVAFNELGVPYVYSYALNSTNDMNTGSIVLKCGQFTKTITIAAATGAVSVE
ncbi:MAG TPA: GspH/FimT family pseudopilin [Tepidisphaeraceae bacterium]|nr:GspH/FimT family pseudopilin [Tepidisphaeraceae bacterium]